MIKVIIYLFFTGLLFGSGLCMASCGPILISYVVGTKKNVLGSIKVYLEFSLARVFVYIMLSLLIFFFGRYTLEHLLGGSVKYIFVIGGSFIVLVGILMILGKHLQLGKAFQFLQRNILERDSKSVILFGLIVGLLPCTPLIAMLSYAGLASKSWIDSLFYSASFGLGTVLSPLLLLTGIVGFVPKILADRKPIYSHLSSLVCSLIIIFFGLQLIIGAF